MMNMNWRKRKKKNRLTKSTVVQNWNQYKCIVYAKYAAFAAKQKGDSSGWGETIAILGAARKFNRSK